MIIACPACSTRYVVPDNAIGVDGRTVRCAKCKHAWFQDGVDVQDVTAGAPAAPTQPSRPSGPANEEQATTSASPAARPKPQEPAKASPPAPPPAEPAASKQQRHMAGDETVSRLADADAAPRRQTVDFDETPPPSFAEQRGSQINGPDIAGPAFDEDAHGVSRFDHAPPFGPRRNVLKLWTLAAILFAVLAVGTIFAVQRLGPPDWWPIEQPLFGAAQPDLALSFPQEAQRWRQLENGSWMFTARIEITNTARETRDLPPVLIVMLNEREDQIYSWVVEPPQDTLAPGETISIDEARTDVPRAAVYADVGWAPY